MLVDFKLTLHYFAKDREWRVYTESGEYCIANSVREVSNAVASMLVSTGDSMAECGNSNYSMETKSKLEVR